MVVALSPLLTALGNGTDSEDDRLVAALAAAQELYAMNCSVCHGPTGGGLAEARLVFPPEERHCTRCHKPNNPVVQPLTQPFVDNDMFPVGDPPALHAASEAPGPSGPSHERTKVAMASVASPAALFAYVKATMPRYDPGRHSDAEYWLLAAHLLQLNERSAEASAAVSNALTAGWTGGEP